MSWVARALHRVVRLYQSVFAYRLSPCRYVPSCSNYALESLEMHGAARGGWLATRRVFRCHPWGGHGWDPVPLRPDSAPDAGVRDDPTSSRLDPEQPVEHPCST